MSHRSAMPLSQSEATERLFHRSHRFILLDDSHEMTALFLMPGIKVCFCWKNLKS